MTLKERARKAIMHKNTVPANLEFVIFNEKKTFLGYIILNTS